MLLIIWIPLFLMCAGAGCIVGGLYAIKKAYDKWINKGKNDK